MKKALSLILALAMALSLAACGGGKTETPSDSNTPADNTSAEPTKLSLILRGGTYADVIKECLPAFEAEHNVVCEVQELSEGDLYSGIALDAINDKGSYDLCMVDGSWMAEFTENGVLANLTELGYSLDEDVIPATTTICYVGDDLYLAPYYGNVTVLLYNKANVEAAGYTGDTILSLEDMLAICEKAKADGKLGFIYRGDSQNNLVVDFLPILLSYGGWVIDSNNQPTVNTPEFKDAMNFYLKLIATGSAQVKDDLIASCDTGAGTMGVGWPGWYTPTADSAADYSPSPVQSPRAARPTTRTSTASGPSVSPATARIRNSHRAADLPDGQGRPEVHRSLRRCALPLLQPAGCRDPQDLSSV